MPLRKPVVRGRFYPFGEEECRQEIKEYLKTATEAQKPERVVAGLVPHAGWVYSGPTAAKVFFNIKKKGSPDTFIVFGSVHTPGVYQAAMFGRGAWETPLGEAQVDEELADALLESASKAGRAGEYLSDDPRAHAMEHSIEVQLPFIQFIFPRARILPIMVPPEKWAPEVGKFVGETVASHENGKNVVIIGTTDLTHYGYSFYGFAPAGVGHEALKWAKANDERLLKLVLEMKAEEVVNETCKNHNACGGGAVAATVAAARALGAERGFLLEHITSYEVMPRGEPTDFVGYAAVIF